MIRFWFARSLCRFLLALLCTVPLPARAEEGMYPINLLSRLDLRAKGLELNAADLFQPQGVGLVNAVVRVGGCTGSFVSPDGLILTNHHCAFGFVQAISSKEHDYVTDGYRADSRAKEALARGATVRITESYRDVTADILASLTDAMSAITRSQEIDRKSRELVQAAEQANPGKKAEVSEMVAGKSYILFLYTTLRDIRLVYVPPRSIGEYGGEDDNFEWPRHTGDFSFLRAYVAPDGSPAEYSPSNVPYHPRKYLTVQPMGVKEGDPVFILGYPGRTYRHRPAAYLAFEENIRMPYVLGLYRWQIAAMERIGARDRAIALKFDARVKGLANVVKNYEGKIVGMKRLHLIDAKRKEENDFQRFLHADSARFGKYGHLLRDIDGTYREAERHAYEELTLDNLRSASQLYAAGLTLVENAMERQRLEAAGDTAGTRRSGERASGAILGLLKDFDRQADQELFLEMVRRAVRLPANQRIPAIDAWVGKDTTEQELAETVDRLFRTTGLSDEEGVRVLATGAPDKVLESSDPMLRLAFSLIPAVQEARERKRERESELSKFQSELNDARMEFLQHAFVPDANSTLRFTSGSIKGYSPADATWCEPITTLDGVMEKATGADPFRPPAKLAELYRLRQWGRFALPGRNTIPVALLYDLDTTGGNSGSPLMNAKGELVGVNFDRAFEATVNDYAWSARYSRSIAVDIRYVLWVTSEFGGAGSLLQEMGVQ